MLDSIEDYLDFKRVRSEFMAGSDKLRGIIVVLHVASKQIHFDVFLSRKLEAVIYCSSAGMEEINITVSTSIFARI